MADRSNKKEPTPPPLLLMPAGGGLTLTPPDQPNLLMPIVQSEPSLIDEEGEADSFVGQSPPPGGQPFGGGPPPSHSASATPKVNYFQDQHGSSTSDPFAQIGKSPAPPPPSQGFPPPVAPTFSMSSVPPQGGASSVPLSSPGQSQGSASSSVSSVSSGGSGPPPMSAAGPPKPEQGGGHVNVFRQKGPVRYAQPPSGTYAAGSQSESSAPPPFSSPAYSSAPPSGFAPGPFMTPGPASSAETSPYTAGPPPGSAPPPRTQGPPAGQAGPSYGRPNAGYMQPMGAVYHPVRHHWCYMKNVEGRDIWYTFSRLDSNKLEEQYMKEKQGGAPEIVSTDGGRYDVEVGPRIRRAVYWEEEPIQIRRCSWFYKREGDNRYVPYEEEQAQRLEMEYKNAIERNDWHRRLEFPGNETIVMHSPQVIVHYQASSQPDEWGNVQADQRPRVVKRGVDDFDSVEDGESAEVDHLVFILHGIGEACGDSRSIIESVDDFRSVAYSLLKSHFGPYVQNGHIRRVEFLPILWSSELHSDTTGVDSRLNAITLPTTSRLRHFFNKTLMDGLFYTSPAYCQLICDTAGREMNRLFQVFLARNPTFSGEVSVAGHSLGSSIMFDLLMHQRGLDANFDVSAVSLNDTQSEDTSLGDLEVEEEPEEEEEDNTSMSAEPELTLESLLQKVGLQDKMEIFHREQIDLESLSMCSEADLKDIGLPMGPRKKLLLVLQEEKGKQEKKTVQDLEKKIRKELLRKMKKEKAVEKKEATVQRDASQNSISVDYICGLAGTGQPFVRYPQLEFSPSCFFALGSPIGVFLAVRGVQTMGDTFRLPTCPRVFNIFHPLDPVAYRLEPMINSSAATVKPVLVPHYKGRKRLHLELKDSIARMGTDLKQRIMDSLKSTWNSLSEFARAHRTEDAAGIEKEVDKQVDSVMSEMQGDMDRCETASICSSVDEEISMGQLNEGRRVDYVLQEKPIESFNDYLFALASHTCYWTSEDTALLMLKEIYMPLGIRPIMPGPDGKSSKMPLPASQGPPLKSVAPYPGSQPTPLPPSSFPAQPTPVPAVPPHPSASFPQPSPTSFPQPSTGSLPPPPPPPPMGAAMGNQHIQGPMKRVNAPFGIQSPSGPGSQGSSRSNTPPVGSLAMPQGQPGAPPPMSGFIR